MVKNINPVRNLFSNGVKKILLIRYSAIGDVVLATPIIELLKKRFPKSSLSMLVSPTTCPIVEKNPFLDRIIIYERDKGFPYLKCVKLLRKERFDLIVSLQWKAGLLTFLSQAKYRVGFHKSLRYRYLYNLRPKEWYPDKHALCRYLNTIEPLRIEGKIPEPKIYLSREEEESAWKFLEEKGILTENFLIGFNPTAGLRTREWSLKHYIQLGKKLIERYNAKIIIFGEKEERSLKVCQRLQNLIGKNAFSLAGRTNLRQLAALAKCCRLFITGDTGPMHIATAVGTKVIAFFGAANPKKSGPWGEKHIILEDKNSPCLHCYKKECKKMDCMKNITPAEVLERIK